MKLNFTLIVMFLSCMVISLTAQESVMELKEKAAEIGAKQADLQAQVDAYQGELDGISAKLDVLGGWQTGLLGSVGFNLASQSDWEGSANPNSSSANPVSYTHLTLPTKRIV